MRKYNLSNIMKRAWELVKKAAMTISAGLKKAWEEAKKMKKEIKVEWCKNFIKSVFEKIPFENGGIEVGCFWNKAEKSGLWERGTYGSAMSSALSELTVVETVNGENGEYLYTVFRLAK